jgi:PAS domain S-box-containing protein
MASPSDPLIQALHLAAIVQGSDDAIISKNTDGIIMSWNGAAERMFGHTAAEAVGKSIRIIIPPDRQGEEDMVLARIRRGERVEHFETVRCRRNGEQFDVSITVSPMRAPDGRIIGASKIARDISERKRTERALAEARLEQHELRRRLSTIIDASSSLLLSPRLEDVLPAILTVARQVLTADACAVWRRDGEAWRIAAAYGLGDSALIPVPGEWPQTGGDLMVVGSTATDPRVRSRAAAYEADGIESMLVVPLQIAGDRSAAISFYYRVLHEFTEVERESASGLGRLASAVIATAQMYDAQRRRRLEADFIAEASTILVTSSDYRDALSRLADRMVPQLADWCAFHLHGEESSLDPVAVAVRPPFDRELIERFVREAPGDDDAVFSVDRVARTGQPSGAARWNGEPALADSRRRAAEELQVGSFVSVPLRAHSRSLGALTLGWSGDGQGSGAADVRFAEDLAYRVSLSVDNILSYEEAKDANRLKDEFLANLSHELRTPLNAIVGYAQMLRKGAMPEEKKARAYEVLDKNASALTQIVEDVLDISRIVSGKIRLKLLPVLLAPIVVQSVETVQPGADAKGVQIDVDTKGDRSLVAGDADRLQQVFWNLLSNAVKFTPRDGRVVVSMAMQDGHCQVSVSDNGTGIEPKFLPHIFERFRQGDSRYGREHGGLGLGLAIARQIVEMHGGVITAESAGPGLGATFRVTLPVLPH